MAVTCVIDIGIIYRQGATCKAGEAGKKSREDKKG
jgi:hypothetical protein